MTAAAGPHPPSLSPTGLLVLGWVGAIAAGFIFISLAWQVATYAPLVVLDAKVATWLHRHGTPEVTAFMMAVTTVHSIAGSALLAALFGLVLARLREWYWLLTLTLSVVGGLALNTILKLAYGRARPYFDDPWVTLSTYSFPSGHTAVAVLLYGVMAAFLASRFYARRQRAVCVIGAVLAVALVAFSRMYLGAHYLSDVLAAACSSVVWLVLSLSAVHALARRRTGRPVERHYDEWRWIGIAVAIAALGVLALYTPFEQWDEVLERKLGDMDVLAALAIFLAASVVGTLLLVPASLFQLAAGAVFGFLLGSVAALASGAIAAVLALLASRSFLHGRIERWARRNRRFEAFARAVEKDGWKVVALMRLSPILSSSVKSYFFGLTRIDLATYTTATLAGILPGLLLRVYLGAAGRDAITGGLLQWALLGAGIAASIGVSIVVRRFTRSRVDLG